jgi:hypothetical protein
MTRKRFIIKKKRKFDFCRNNFDIKTDEKILFEYGSERKKKLKIQPPQEVCMFVLIINNYL